MRQTPYGPSTVPPTVDRPKRMVRSGSARSSRVSECLGGLPRSKSKMCTPLSESPTLRELVLRCVYSVPKFRSKRRKTSLKKGDVVKQKRKEGERILHKRFHLH